MLPHGYPRPWHNGAPPMYPQPQFAINHYVGGPAQLPPVTYYGAGAAVFRQPAPFVPPPPQVQSVTAVNFAAELDLLGYLLPMYPCIVVDTEYPGTFHLPPDGLREIDITPDERYALVKANVDELPIVQLGLTLCDRHGNLPFVEDYVTGQVIERGAWEVNFSDFDVNANGKRYSKLSVEFLQRQGINFKAARERGVSSAAFKNKLAEILSAPRGNELTWVAFGGAYDLAYLVKMLSDGQPLPGKRAEFMARVRALLGGRVFDAKYMADNCGRGELRDVGLRTVAEKLGLAPPPPPPHSCLAGPKSLAASRIHAVMTSCVLSQDAAARHEGRIDGLQ